MKEKKRALVLGLGESGVSAALLLFKKGYVVSGYEDNQLTCSKSQVKELQKKGLFLIENAASIHFEQIDLVVVSPGFSPTHSLYLRALEAKVKLIGEIELGISELENSGFKNKLIAITGTNGKTTVTLLVEHILNSVGIKAKALGNVGIPLTAYLQEKPCPDEVLVIELSSYQIETLSSKAFDEALLLNITPDHLDRYGTIEEYAKTKIKLEHYLKSEGSFYLSSDCYASFKHLFKTTKLKLFDMDLENVYLNRKEGYIESQQVREKNSHEFQNMWGAYSLLNSFNISTEDFFNAYHTFKKPPHRIEFVREFKGVSYYDDSKGTNIDAVIKAVSSIGKPLYLIAGGVDKGSSYSVWKKDFEGVVKKVFLIGESANKIREDLLPDIESEICENLKVAVQKSSEEALTGEAVLLSPGCSSLDMFKDYRERGEFFKQVVNNL